MLVNSLALADQEGGLNKAHRALGAACSLRRSTAKMVEELLHQRMVSLVVRLDSLLPPPRRAVASAQVLGRYMKST